MADGYARARDCPAVCMFSHKLVEPANLSEVLNRASAVFAVERFAPVHIEIHGVGEQAARFNASID